MALVKLEDYEILQGEPVRIRIGKKFALLKEFPVGVFFTKFVPEFTALLSVFGKELDGIDFPVDDDWKDRDRLERFRASLTASFNSDRLRRGFVGMLKRLGIIRMSVRYFEKHAKVSDLVKLFVGTYRYNVDGVKKNVRRALQETQDLLSRTSTPSSNVGDGLPPGQYETLPARFHPSGVSPLASQGPSSSSGGNGKRPTPPNNGRSSGDEPKKPEPQPIAKG